MTKITYIPGEIANAAIDEHGNRKPVTRTQHIFDDAKGKSQADINEEFGNAIGGLNSQNYVTVDSFNALPATGSADTVYRVSNWDGTQQDPTVYSEYAWNGSQYVHLSTKTQIGEVFDISAYHATGGNLATYADLSAALDSNNGGGVPQSLQKGGMSVKFVQSNDNKYVQYFLTKDQWSASEADWEKTNLEEEVDELVSNRFYGVFVNGSLTNGELLPSIRKRISSKEILSYDREIEIIPKSGFKFGLHFFENGVFVRDSGWQSSPVKIQKGVAFKVVIARVTESESEVANIDEFLSGVYVTNIIDFVNTKAEPVYSSLGMSESKIEYPTRNGSKGNPSNRYAVVWLDIPCAGYKKICFRINKPFAASGNIFAFCYTLPNGTYRDNLPEDIQNGFYQDTQDKWLELSCDGLQTITIQAFETSLPSSYPDTFSPLRKEDFHFVHGLQYYFCGQTIKGLSATIGGLDSLSTTDKSDIVHAINEVDSNIKLTNKYNLFRVIEGKGQTFSDGYIYGLQSGQKYIFNLSKTSWDITGVTGGNYFAISNWYNDSYTSLVQINNQFPETNEIEFTIPQNSDFIAIGGRAAVGEKITGYITNAPEFEDAEKMLVHKKMVSTYYGNQGLTIVGNTIIQFNSGVDDHSSYAAVRRWSKEDFTFIDGMTHNLGHAATIDYDSTIDALVVGNGTSDTSVAPRLDIVLSASAKFADGSPLNYNDADILHIELKTDKKEIGGSGLICCYGGNWREVFLATGQNAPRKIFRCLLGVGEEDFSDNTVEQNDVTSWGTFIPGKTNTEYNGTLKVLATYTGEETQVYQGMCYRAGFIYLACGYSQPLVHKIRLNINGRYEIVQTNIPQDYNADGSLKSVEPEGLCFYDGATMLVALPSYGGLFQIEAF